MAYQFSMAQRAKGILVSAGHNTDDSVTREIAFGTTERDIAWRNRQETGRRAGSLTVTNSFCEDIFSTQPVAHDEALVRYEGSPRRDADRLRLYRLALENCSFRVTEEGDPEREGRRILRVVRS
mgnify:CR=1 FL=1